MSIGVMTWVWNHSRSRNGARLVLLAIADSAADNGTNAWPSIATLARKSGLSPRGVQTAVRELEKLGELKTKLNAGQNGSNRYAVIMKTPADSAPPQILHPEESAGVDTGTESDTTPQDPPQILRGADSAPPQNSADTPADSAPETSLTHPSSSSSKKTRTSPSARGASGTRIPDDFVIDDAMTAWCRQKVPKLTRWDADEITEEFVDYWRGVAGAKGLKADWTATWRNWIKRKAKDLENGARTPAAPRPGRTTPAERLAQSQQIVDDMRRLDEAEAAGQPIVHLFGLPPGRST